MAAPPLRQTDPSPRVAEKRRRRRREILHAALEAFRQRGYHATTLEDLAARLGIRKAALYHYFPDKEAILYACHRDSLDEVERILREAPTRAPDALGRLRFVIREHVRVMADTLEGSSLAFETSSLDPAHVAEVVSRRDRYEAGVRALIQQGIAEGAFRPVDPKVAAFAVFGAINWIARWYRPGGSLDSAELGARFADYLTGGLLCR